MNSSGFVSIEIMVRHEYFGGNTCGLEMQPDIHTVRKMQRYGMLLKKYNNCKWLFMIPGKAGINYLQEEETDMFNFNLVNAVNNFYYFTSPGHFSIEGKNCLCKYIGNYGIFCQMKFFLSNHSYTEAKSFVKVVFSCPEKFIEFVLIPKYQKSRQELRLADRQSQQVFKYMGKMSIPGEVQPAFRFVSEKPVKLKEKYPWNICLWEQKKYGEELICTNIPHPHPGSVSLTDPSDTIITYYYI